MIRFILFILILMPLEALAREKLVVDLASDHVDITTGFDGADLVLYGVRDEKTDVAIVVEGPAKETIVRRKGQVLGAWMNVESMEFKNVPGFYDYALSKAEEDFDPVALQANGIGLNALKFPPEDAPPQIEKIREFQEAMIRNKQFQKLFPMGPQAIKFLDEHFFRVNIYFPPNVPVGDYKIRTILLKNGKLAGEKELVLKVAQVGLSASIYQFATEQSLYYGLLCVFMALFAGWLINVIRSR